MTAGGQDSNLGKETRGFRIHNIIKDGSVGRIYLAERNGQLFALKMIFEKHLGRSDKISSFWREAEVACSLNHPHVIRTLEYHTGPPRPFIVMEYFPSENLRYLMSKEPARLAGAEYSILRQVADALCYCHSQGIVHRDLKPDNVLIGKDSAAKVIDFSIATTRMQRFFSFLRRKTAGSPNYMPPEQILNKKVDHRADLYSFGVMALELLTGTNPFAGHSLQETLDKHRAATPPRASSLNKSVSSEVSDLLEQLLKKTPDERPGSFGHVVYILSKKELEISRAKTAGKK